MTKPNKYLTEEERIEARKAYLKQWMEANREKRLEYHKQRYQANKEKMLEQMKQWREANKAKISEQKKQYREANKNKLAEKQKQWYVANRDKMLEYAKQCYVANKENILEQMKQYNKTPMGRARYLVNGYTQSDRKYNRGECTITAQWIIDNIFSSKCHYCEESDWKKLGCDRIDNSLPHTEDNVVPCCEECNIKRGSKSYEEFINEIR